MQPAGAHWRNFCLSIRCVIFVSLHVHHAAIPDGGCHAIDRDAVVDALNDGVPGFTLLWIAAGSNASANYSVAACTPR